jgi:2-oxoglutarate/2-oxoacid ferredoxin oxidoreductase subunit alpha
MIDFTLGIGGPAGMGIKTVGQTFCKVMLRDGYYVLDNDEYPSLIRGGHNVLFARVSDEKIFSHNLDIHVMLCLDKGSIAKYAHKMSENSVLIYDSTRSLVEESEYSRSDVNFLGVPLKKLAIEEGGNIIMVNTVALGAAFAIMGHEIDTYKQVLREQFGHKSAEIVEGNLIAASAGYNFVKSLKEQFRWSIPKKERKLGQDMLLSGNEAITLGMINAGCKFYGAYPMTPASAIMGYFAAYETEYNLIMKHTEDEIAAMNMAIGAWHTGVRAACGTSGGGFSLMVEGLGFAGVSEAGVVCILSQRPGPATGVPTFTGQADLRFALHASQDEFPRIIIAPGNVEDCFYEIQNAFNLADRYQTPVILMSDKYQGESHFYCPPLDDQRIKIDRGQLVTEAQSEPTASVGQDRHPGQVEGFKRYRTDTPDGVSPRSIPGVKNAYFLANSYEHDEKGFATEEADERIRQVDKRARKEAAIMSELPMPVIYGQKEADITLVCWGSNKMIGQEVLRLLNSSVGQDRYPGIPSINLLHFTYISPLNWEKLAEIMSGLNQTLCFEGNSQGQLAGLIREKTGHQMSEQLLKYDGRPIAPEEVIAKLYEITHQQHKGLNRKRQEVEEKQDFIKKEQ